MDASRRPVFRRVQARSTSRSALEPFRAIFERLYVQEKQPLDWIMKHMKEQYGVVLSVKQYKSLLKVWGLRHNLTQRDAAFILRLLNKARSEGLEELVLFSGAVQRREDIARYILRSNSLADENSLLSCISHDDTTPHYIRLRATEGENGLPNTPQPPPTSPSSVIEAHTQNVPRRSQPFVASYSLEGLQPDIDPTPSTLHAPSTSSHWITPSTGDAFHHEGILEFNAFPADVNAAQTHSYNPASPDWHRFGDVDPNLPHANVFSLPSSPTPECPPAPVPAPIRTDRPDSARSAILQHAFLPAVLISEHLRGTSPGLWMTAQPMLEECRTLPDADVLSKCIDLLAWTQISNQIISLAVIYLLRALLHLSGECRSIWAIWIACIRIAQILLEDGSFEIHVWQQALPAVGEPTIELAQAEILLLTCSDLSFVVEPREWDVLTQRLEHVSGSCVQRLETLLSNAVRSSETMSRWEQHKAEIGQLYQHHSLEEVVRLMKERHQFAPSIRGYRQRIAEWGFKKRQTTSLARGPGL
ncbi:hypothetical protein PV04_00163 [Phialophora macrospora]|uniref:Clr5 domain-containing protein n=1 Tax=Phialophora macrospora TaxID=1851006 RepID=A0A0D2ECE3_9EURO|nr:hypothetical protein PV04_00163 [Phialophora macrospora]